ncbi:glycosyltransferase family 2 protein [Clostridium aestuarii]|uniref:Glycosyltransferase family 2 protein n=1 Tax=Clostridium aestuarii TaxID=338193 RepID=A0ABT4D3H1_9CLOT|nr:glycosyltransferase family 2 protein [Clostridium aestuarii]MCY6485792.1 glycosyltransferase family 2 protein [Clostridium aestuarii]
MISISLCMIVKDEEKILERCLKSVGDLVDEIIIVDTGSTDNTKKTAYKFNSKVFDFKWIDDFSAARNFAFSKAAKEYILWLDADDVLLEEDRQKLKELKETLDTSIDSVNMIYNYAFDKNGNVILSFRRNRLVKRVNNFKWYGAVHEYLGVHGKIIDSDIHITHKREKFSGNRNLKIYESRLKKGEELSARDIYYYANELYDHKKHDRAIEYYIKFLNRKDGWVEDKIAACGKISDSYYFTKNIEAAKKYCYKSFEYAMPRAEFCCKLGFCFLSQNKLNEAVFWYELATKLKKPDNCWGFLDDSSWTWLPHIQLCVCYHKLGDKDLSYKHNEIARSYNPDDKNILNNKKYFQSLGYE